MSKSIVQWDIDQATYIGDEEDGVYYQVGERKSGKSKGWYVTALLDSNSASYTAEIATDEGPFDTEEEAAACGKDIAISWCIDNEVDYRTDEEKSASSLDTFSELMFGFKWKNTLRFDELMAKPDYAKFMTMEESELTPELAEELSDKIDQLESK